MTTRPWTTKPLGEIAEVLGGGTPPRSDAEMFGADIDWVTPSDLPPIGEVRSLAAVAEGLTWKGLERSSAKRLPAGTVLYSSRASIGKIAVADRQCCTNQGFANFVPHAGILDPWYLAYYLASKTPEIEALAGTTTFKEVSRGKLREFPISYPSLPSQHEVVAIVQERLARVEEILTLRAESRRVAQSLFSACLNESAVRGRWAPVPLAELLADTQNGRSIRSDGGGNGTVLTLSAVRSARADLSAMKRVALDEAVAKKYAVRKGDVFISRSNTRDLVGLSSIVADEPPEALIFPDLLIRLTPRSERVHGHFLAYGLRFPDVRRQIQEKATGTSQSMVKISAERLREVLLPVPPRAEQERLAEELEATHEACAAVQASLLQPEVDHMRSAILRKAFSFGV
jgi:type I restriction enzyme, S subunit